MSALTLELLAPPRFRLDLRDLTPTRLVGRSRREIAAIPLRLGRQPVTVGDLFRIDGEAGDALRLLGTTARCDFIGAELRDGDITVEGSVGAYAGVGMRGGRLRVFGDAGVYAGARLAGGELRVEGNAGDFLGAALPGDTQGMNGGAIIVGGHCGARAGDRQRRGLILVHGNAGDYCASRMVAGTVAVLGQCGHQAGFFMRRGTLLLRQPPLSRPATFNDNGARTLPFVALLSRELERFSDALGSRPCHATRVRRYLGDRAIGGMGEQLELLA